MTAQEICRRGGQALGRAGSRFLLRPYALPTFSQARFQAEGQCRIERQITYNFDLSLVGASNCRRLAPMFGLRFARRENLEDAACGR